MRTCKLMAPCHFGLEAVLKREIYDLGYEITAVEDGKVYFEGDTRAREMSAQDTHDQTIDTQVQTKIGVGCVFSNVFGKYNLT